MKRICSLALTLLLLLSLSLAASASEGLPSVIDRAGLLSEDEKSVLAVKIGGLQDTYRIDVVLLTVDSLEGERAQNYADDYYDENGYGEDGFLFLLAMEEREWYISTSGSVIYALTDYGIQQTAEAALPDLSSGNYFDGFSAFLDALPGYLEAQESGTPIDGYADYSGDSYHGDREQVVRAAKKRHINFLFPVIFGLAAAGITVGAMCAAMNTKRPKGSAADYLKEGSFRLRSQRDLFLYSTVTKNRIQRNDSDGGGGGSSVHTGSSGRSHGGGGGHF